MDKDLNIFKNHLLNQIDATIADLNDFVEQLSQQKALLNQTNIADYLAGSAQMEGPSFDFTKLLWEFGDRGSHASKLVGAVETMSYFYNYKS